MLILSSHKEPNGIRDLQKYLMTMEKVQAEWDRDWTQQNETRKLY